MKTEEEYTEYLTNIMYLASRGYIPNLQLHPDTKLTSSATQTAVDELKALGDEEFKSKYFR